MIASLDISPFLDKAHRVADLIIHSEEMKHYHRTKARLEQDTLAQNLIRKFVNKKEAFEEVERFGRYHPDYHQVKADMRALKREIDLLDTVAEFKKAEKELESILDEVSKILAFSVSEQIKVPSGNPFWDQIGCGGSGCGSGGCGSGGCGNGG